MSRTKLRVERLLWIVAAVALAVYANGWLRSSIYQSYANWSFVRTLNGQPVSAQQFALDLLRHPNLPVPPVGANIRLPSATAPEMWRLEIPRIDLSVIVNEGTGRESLARGVGHIEGTALPGSAGNAGLAGHRDTYFRRLGELLAGDAIRIVSMDGIHEYAVDKISIVGPKATEVLRDTGSPSITLVTCYPFWTLGRAPKRYIVHANLISKPWPSD